MKNGDIMNKIIKKTYELISVLENSDIIKNIQKYKLKVMLSPRLISLIDKAKNEDISDKQLIEIKKELYQDENYKNYIDNYNKLNYIVLEINSRYKKIIATKNCKK